MVSLEREHRVAFARVITDLIEADFVVEADEMQFFESVISKEGYSITRAMLVEAKRIDFAKALSILKELDEPTRRMMVETLRGLAMSDGECVPLEAILIFAVEQVLMYGAVLHSIPQTGIVIDNLKVIYIENIKTAVGVQIDEHLSGIIDEFEKVGFDFIYIPRLIRDFGRIEHDYLRKVVRYMIPSASEERVSTICDKLQGLTTARFCRDLLYKKLGLNLIDCEPSLLFKINDSDIVDRYDSEEVERVRYGNYLQLGLQGDVIERIHTIVEAYREMISHNIMVENNPRDPKFIYSGFHRSLFDLIAFGRELKEYRLVIDVRGHSAEVYFEPTDGGKEQIIVKLNPQETALYYVIVTQSLKGKGLDWREHIPTKDKQVILAEYNRIYSQIGKANSVTEYKDRTQIHHIKQRIRALTSNVANVSMFVPEHYKSGSDSYYRVKASGDFVVMKEKTTL